MSDDLTTRIVHWLERALDRVRLTEDELARVQVDVDGLYDAAQSITALVDRTISDRPSRKRCESLLIELSTDVEHLFGHWRSLTSVGSLQHLTVWDEAKE